MGMGIGQNEPLEVKRCDVTEGRDDRKLLSSHGLNFYFPPIHHMGKENI